METLSALLAICAGNSPAPGEFPAQRPVTRSFDVFFDLRLNKRLIKQWWGWWFETSSCPLWRHRNVMLHNSDDMALMSRQCNDAPLLTCLGLYKSPLWTLNYYIQIFRISLRGTGVIARGSIYQHGISFPPAWIGNHMPCKVYNEITYPV